MIEKKWMKTRFRHAALLLLVSFLSAAAPGAAKQAPEPGRVVSFAGLKAALEAGGRVRLVIHYAKCRLVDEGKEVPAPEAVGGMVMDTWEYFARGAVRNDKAFVSTSETVLINHPRYGRVHNYVKFNVYDDDSVKITVQYFAPGTLEVKMEEFFHTVINDGRNDGGLYLYLQ